MKISNIQFIPISIPYKKRQISTQIQRDGTTDVIIKIETDEGVVGWGESCSGANVESIVETLKGMSPFVIGRSPWESELIRAELWWRGLWQFRKPTASFAYAGIDMALWDICGKISAQPLYNLLGGRVRDSVSYQFSVLRGSKEDIVGQCKKGIDLGYRHYYMKAGLDIEAELDMVKAIRETIGPDLKIRLDINAAWSIDEAIRNITKLNLYGIDFIEQPVMPDPAASMQEIRRQTPVSLAANEGLWSAEDAYRQIKARTAEIFNFSPYWVGSLLNYQKLCHVADLEGLLVSKHTHGEFGIAATACQHVLLTLHNVIAGNQQSALATTDDILREPLPLFSGPNWGVPQGTGLCIEVDEYKLARYHAEFQKRGQILPYEPTLVGRSIR